MRRRSVNPIADQLFERISFGAAAAVVALLLSFFIVLTYDSRLTIEKFSLSFLVSEVWDPVQQEFGALSSIYGTIVSTAIAMLLALPASFFVAFLLVELVPPLVEKPISYAVELLAAIPSIIYGMWGLFVFAPIMAEYVQPFLNRHLGFLPLFQGPPMGIGMLSAGIILALMTLPFMTAVMRDVFRMTPRALREAAYGMGATTWEVTWNITLRHGLAGALGGFFLGLGRALGETMAVTFVIGNNHEISASLFMPANTIASALANEFAEAAEPMYLSALTELGLILFLITFLVNTLAHFMLKHYQQKGARF